MSKAQKILVVFISIILHFSIMIYFALDFIGPINPIIKIGFIVFGLSCFAYILYIVLNLLKGKISTHVLMVIYFIVLFIAILIQYIGFKSG